MATRKIIHIDADCFYAAVEMREDPALYGKPVAVGGNPRQRGVVATCNYEARSWGVHSAMSMAQALKICPDLIVIPVRMELYRQVSQQIHQILQDYTELIEPLSLDEAFLDVTDSDNCKGSATLMAQEIRSRVWQDLRLVVSAGVAPNKFLAKIASDWRKPNGLFTITPDEVDDCVVSGRLPRRNWSGWASTAAPGCASWTGWSWCASSASLASVCGSWRTASTSGRWRPTADARASVWKRPTARTCRT